MIERTAVPISSSDHHRFFGYFDTCPWDGSGNRILTHEVDFISRPPDPTDEADIVVVDTTSGDRTVVGSTTAWNFQLGSRLQWVGPSYDRRILYNDRVDGVLIARIVDVETREERILSDPIYAQFPDGSTAVSLDFERLHHARPGYGYPVEDSDYDLEAAPPDDGLWLINIDNDRAELVVTFDDLLKLNPVPTMEDDIHWINHVSVSPNGKHIAFFHRWELADGGMYTRLCTADRDGSNLRAVVDTGRVTHYAWRSDEEIMAWAREQSRLNEAAKEGKFNKPLIKPFINTVRYAFTRITLPSWLVQDILGEGYFLYRIKADGSPLEVDLHGTDGHPSFSPDGEWVVFDTYPNADNERELYLVEIASGDKYELGSFYSPSEYNSERYRCDLHPRWNRDGSAICFDSMHEGKREVYTVDVADIVES